MSNINDDEGINLDGQFPDDLMEFHHNVKANAEQQATKLFPRQPLGQAIEAVQILGEYAEYKAKAMRQRASGSIVKALDNEQKCERLYNQLPQFAKW